eukprot:Skav207445  [mRNA]  locus=scaffold1959:265001:265582:- [translate_table: standard]
MVPAIPWDAESFGGAWPRNAMLQSMGSQAMPANVGSFGAASKTQSSPGFAIQQPMRSQATPVDAGSFGGATPVDAGSFGGAQPWPESAMLQSMRSQGFGKGSWSEIGRQGCADSAASRASAASVHARVHVGQGRSAQPCMYCMQGKCAFGRSCWYSHLCGEAGLARVPEAGLCQAWEKYGFCAWGRKCRFQHR